MSSGVSSALPTDEASAIELRNVEIAFRLADRSEYRAVRDIDLSVAPGEFVTIVGPTGCGKSTILNAVAGLVAVRGNVRVFGAPLAGLNTRAGYLFQQDALMPWKTALANVAVALEPAGVPVVEARDKARLWLQRVGLANFLDRYPHQLSGGQRKRVALAQTLIRDPEILLMDEPFGPLDAQTRTLMGDLLLSLWSADRKAVLFVTHDLDEAISLADRVLVMSAGPAARIIAEHRIDLPRPRASTDIRLEPRFHALQRAIWADLRDEVMRAYDNAKAGPE
ncbi:MAG: ABC transporter ATP-binding protein [Methylobacteriaceae bacterium]|nr:ABC transporter ATP-binding protein [Methylobacteriaceae bacterium]